MKNYRTICVLCALLAFSSCRKPCHEYCEIVSEAYVHKYGMEVAQDEWKSRGQNGLVNVTLGNGVHVSKSYSNGVLDGRTTYSFPHSHTIAKEEIYSNGILTEKITNNPLGSPKKKTQYLSPTDKVVTRWFEKGSPQSIECYSRDLLVDGEYFSLDHQLEARVDGQEGIRTIRNANGDLLKTETIAHGKPISQTTYHPNGSISAITPLNAKGQIDGQRKSYLITGEPEKIEEWYNGRQDGITVQFQYGEKYAEIPYVNGEKHGLEKRYKDGTVVVEEITWTKGQKHGPCQVYVDNTTTTKWYFKDMLVHKTTFDQMSRVAK